MSGMVDHRERSPGEAGQSGDSEVYADQSSSPDVENEQRDPQAEIKAVLERMSRSQSIASVYVDRRSGVFFNRGARILGDVVGRDQGKQGRIASILSSGDVVAGYVPEEVLRKASAVYSPPSCHGHARATLAERHVLLLWGPARSGKWTAALQLLREVQPERVVEIKPDVAVGSLLSLEPEGEEAYVVDTLSSETCQDLTATNLGRLSERFRIANSYLVITIDKSVFLSESILGAYLENWDKLPAPRRVLETHIKWWLDGADDKPVLELADSAQVRQLLEGQLAPGEVDRLVELLLRVTRSEFDLTEGLSQFETSAVRSLEEWFRTHDSLDQHAFMISIAVLNGSGYEVIAEASKRLSSLIRESLGDASLQAEEASLRPRTSRLEEAGARIVEGFRKTEFGRCPVELVMLNNLAYQPRVLRHVWTELDWLRAPVVLWLGNLSRFGSLDDQTKAAAAVGELCKLDFPGTVAGIVRPWANDPDPGVRAAAAFALGVPAWDARCAPHVLGLLHHWSTLRNNWRLNWTAAVAYAGLAGQRFPNVALRELLAMAGGGDSRLRSIAGEGLLRLLASLEGESNACLGLLDALVDTTMEGCSIEAARDALLLFLELLRVETSATDSTEETCPMLLRASRGQDVCRDRVVSLWRRALNTKSVRRIALDTLRAHVTRSEEVPGLYEVVEGIVSDLAGNGTGRESQRLQCNLKRWATDHSETSDAARRLLANFESNASKEGRLVRGNE